MEFYSYRIAFASESTCTICLSFAAINCEERNFVRQNHAEQHEQQHQEITARTKNGPTRIGIHDSITTIGVRQEV